MSGAIDTSSYINFLHLQNLAVPELSAFYAKTEGALKPGHINGPKIRDCYMLQYVHTGCGIVMINNESFRVHAGQCFMMFPGAVISQIADEHEPWGKTWVCLYGSKVPQMLKILGISEENPVFPWEDCPELLEEMTSYISILDKNSPSFEFDQCICGNRLFKLLFKYCEHELSMQQPSKLKEDYIQRAIKYIEYNYTRRITVNDIAEHLGLNRTYFAGLFKSFTKQSPQEFLLKRRIEKACDFLKNPNSTVASVAYSLGYEPRAFIRLFKNVMGIPPSEYRKSFMGSHQATEKTESNY